MPPKAKQVEEDEIELLEEEEEDASSRSSQSSSSRSGRARKSRNPFDPSPEPQRGTSAQGAKKKQASPAEKASDNVAGKDGASDAPAPSAGKHKRRKSASKLETKGNSCLWSSCKQDTSGVELKNLPWAKSTVRTESLKILFPPAQKMADLTLNAGDTVRVWSDKKNQRSITYNVAWFYKEDGANSWSMELLHEDGQMYIRTKVSLVIAHTPGDSVKKKQQREDHLTTREAEQKEAQGVLEKKAKRRLSTATKAAGRLAKHARADPLPLGDVHDLLTQLGSLKKDMEVLISAHQGVLEGFEAQLEAHKELKIFYDERVNNLADILGVQLKKAAPK